MSLNMKLEKNQMKHLRIDPKLEKIINQIKTYIGNYLSKYEEIENIILFGSLASGRFNENSDIDICILF